MAQGGHHWYQKENIVKGYILKQGVAVEALSG